MNMQNIHKTNSLRSYERLKYKKQIEMLFQKGEAFSFYPLRVIYRLVPPQELKDKTPLKVGFSVPKKYFKRAHDRNRMKRLMREAWRTQKHELYNAVPEQHQFHCFLVYTSKEMLNFEQVNRAVGNVLKQLQKKIS